MQASHQIHPRPVHVCTPAHALLCPEWLLLLFPFSTFFNFSPYDGYIRGDSKDFLLSHMLKSKT